MDFSILVYVMLVLVVLYYIISWWSSESVQLVNAQTTESPLSIDESNIKGSANCAYSIWVYVSEIDNSNKNFVFKNQAVEVNLGQTNKLEVKVNGDDAMSTVIDLQSDNIHIPMQKWTNILISFEANNVVLYIDGKMMASKLKDGIQVHETKETHVGGEGSFTGEVANFRYFDDYVTVQDAWQIYKEGYGSGFFAGLINKYKLKLSFLKDNSEVAAIQI